MKKLFLVDASAMFFRAYYAVRPLTNSKKLPTNALYGYLQMTVKLLREEKPDYMVYCFDRKDPTFRSEIYPEYKANRGEMPEDLVPQIPYIRKITEALGIPSLDKKGFEADDVIGTLSTLGEKEKLDVYIISGDKDFAQLLSPKVTLWDTMRDIKYDVEKANEKWGIPPEQMIDYLALVGDSSDNVPGVRGVGPKGAQKLLAEFSSLEELYKNLDKVKNEKLRIKLEDAKGNAFLSKDLVTIRRNVELGYKLKDMALKPIDKNEAVSILDELEFKTFEKRLFGEVSSKEETETSGNAKKAKPKKKHKIKLKDGSVTSLKKFLKKGDEVWGFKTDRGLYVGKKDELFEIDPNEKKLVPTLESLALVWKGFALKSFWRGLEIRKVQGCVWDSHLAAYIVRSNQVETFEKLYALYIGSPLAEFPEAVDIYAAQMELEDVLKAKLDADEGADVYFDIELPLLPILFNMEAHGVLLDSDILAVQSKDLETDIKKLEKEIHKLAGESFNVASPKQLGQVLFQKMEIPVVKKTKTGPSTDSSVMEKLAPEHPIAAKVISFRELSKLKSTYVDALPDLMDPDTKRVHTHFNQTVAQTGRLSSTNPNLQNIPIRTERGRLIRKAFVAPKGSLLVSADYSQIELRLLAHITEDQGLCSAFERGLDVHAATASEVFGVPVKEVTKEQRRAAKAVNFGLAYGQSAFGLAESLRISRTDAKEIIEMYFVRFPGVKDYMLEIVEKAKKQGYVETIFGRRRYLPELKAKNGMQRKFGERAAINAPLQGSASDIVKKAMIDLFQMTHGTMVLQVHDELIFEIPKANVEKDTKLIKKKMEEVVKLKVPLVVDISSGKDWDEAH